MLEAVDLTCERGERLLFERLSFSAEDGTLLRIVGGLLEATAGEIRWKGGNIRRLREEYWKDLVYVGHLNGVKDDLTVRENLRVSVRVAGRHAAEPRIAQALDAVGLAGFE